MMLFRLSFALVILLSGVSEADGLKVELSRSGQPFISFLGKPAFGYGPSPQTLLTYLPRGNGNDYEDWVRWAARYRLSHVRSYIPSFAVKSPALNVFLRSEKNPTKFDLNRFNSAYFEELRKACRLMKEHGIIVHLQLWQAVTWKKAWNRNYYNPANNINPEISEYAGPGEFMNLKNSTLLEHQKEYVEKVLESTADLGNVFFDIANEIGNGTASSKNWVLEIVSTVRGWERANNRKVLLTINDEGGKRIQGVDEVFRALDLIAKDLGLWQEHVTTQQKYAKPSISVRNIDYDQISKRRTYFYGELDLEVNSDPIMQTRGRKYWWRMFMARVQIAGAYADTINKLKRVLGMSSVYSIFDSLKIAHLAPQQREASYGLNTLSEVSFLNFRSFIDGIRSYQTLKVYDDVFKKHPAAHAYCLQSDQEIILYLESPTGQAGISYPPSSMELERLAFKDGTYSGYFFTPEDSVYQAVEVTVKGGFATIQLPAFKDDLAIYISVHSGDSQDPA